MNPENKAVIVLKDLLGRLERRHLDGIMNRNPINYIESSARIDATGQAIDDVRTIARKHGLEVE